MNVIYNILVDDVYVQFQFLTKNYLCRINVNFDEPIKEETDGSINAQLKSLGLKEYYAQFFIGAVGIKKVFFLIYPLVFLRFPFRKSKI